MKTNKNFILNSILWVLQGFLVGVGAILPGVSGGSLLYAFGIYNQILEVLSNPIKGVIKYWKMLIFVGIGGAIGFIGFAAIAEALLAWNESLVICAFIGLIIGTLPGLWRDAGEKGRGKTSIALLVVSFIAVCAMLFLFKNVWTVTVPQNLVGWILCGVIWGLGFVVPGLASSNLLMFFGIYEPLLGRIKELDLGAAIPFAVSVLAMFLLFSKVMKWVFDKYHSAMSHSIIGFVLASTVMILPSFATTWQNIVSYIIAIVCGAAASFLFGKFSDKISASAEE